MTTGVSVRCDAGHLVRDRVRAALARLGPVTPGDAVVVGVSGGPDSLTLWHALLALSGEAGFAVHAAHVDHGLRGEESARDARVVAALAERWGAPHTVERVAAGRIDPRPRGLHAAARDARYECLERVADAVGARWIATAHTADDQAETVLMRWARGAGPAALAGIPPVRGRVIRPLLAVSRAEVEAYAAAQGLVPLRDPSNDDPRFLRARVRGQVLPVLRALNPRAAEAIARSAALLTDDAAWLDGQARSALDRARSGGGAAWTELAAAALCGEPPVIRRRMIRWALADLGVSVDRVAAERVDAAARSCGARTSGRFTLGQGAGIEFASSCIRLTRGTVPPDAPPPAPLSEGENRPSGWGVVFRVRRTEAFDASEPLGPWQAAFDSNRLPGMLGVRGCRPGDRLSPEGMVGSKRVQDLLVDAKVPRWRRSSVPVVTAGDEVVWVVGLRQDRRYGARAGTPAIQAQADRVASWVGRIDTDLRIMEPHD